MNRRDGQKVKNWGGYVRQRCIVVEDCFWGKGIEVTILEVSPKGRVKFSFPSGYERWVEKETFLLIEALGVKE